MLYVCVCLLKFKTTAQSSICMCVKVHVSQFTSNLQHKVKNQIIITHRGCSVFVCCIVSFNFQWLRTLFHRWTYIIFFFSIVIKINKNCIFADFVASYRGTKLRKHKAWLLSEIQEPPWTSENKMDEQLMCDYGDPQSVSGHFKLSKSTFGERFWFQRKKHM